MTLEVLHPALMYFSSGAAIYEAEAQYLLTF